MSSHQIHLEPAPAGTLAFYPDYPQSAQNSLREALRLLSRIAGGTEAKNNYALYGKGLFDLATNPKSEIDVAFPCDLPMEAIMERHRQSNIRVYNENDVCLSVGGLTLHIRKTTAAEGLIHAQTPVEAQAIIAMTPNGPVAAASVDFIETASAATKAAYKDSLTPYEMRRKGPALCSVPAMPY